MPLTAGSRRWRHTRPAPLRRPLTRAARLDPAAAWAELAHLPGRPGGIATLGNTTLVSDVDSCTIWQLGRDGDATPLGDRVLENREGIVLPTGMATTSDGTVLVADSGQHRICAVSPRGAVRVIAGGVSGYRDGPAEQAMFRYPTDVAVGPNGTYFVADSGNDRIRAIAPSGSVSTVAGSIYDFGNGKASRASFRRPQAVDVDPNGFCYVADSGNNAIRRISPDGEVITLAGGPPGGDSDGAGPDAGLHGPSGIAVDTDGSLWIADRDNAAVRHLHRNGLVRTALRLPALRWPTAVALRPDGALVVTVETMRDLAIPEMHVLTMTPGEAWRER